MGKRYCPYRKRIVLTDTRSYGSSAFSGNSDTIVSETLELFAECNKCKCPFYIEKNEICKKEYNESLVAEEKFKHYYEGPLHEKPMSFKR